MKSFIRGNMMKNNPVTTTDVNLAEGIFGKDVPTMKEKSINKEGDVVMMKYQGNLVNDYRICRVSKVYPSERGVVRTVEVSYRKKGKDEGLKNYKCRPLSTEKVGVQRLSLLQAVGEELPDCQ